MTGRTHDLAAFTALNCIFATQPIPPMTFSTVIVALGSNMIGGLLPDIDDQTADIWDKARGGSFIARLIKPLIGHHRMISHSIVGLVIVGFLSKYLLALVGTVLLVDMNVVWWSLMIGYVSHLIMDSLTTEGVPWLFPLPFRMGFPPLKVLRVKTGGLSEKIIVFPGLLLLNGYVIYLNYQTYVSFLRLFVK